MKRILFLIIFLPLFGYSQIKVSEMTSATSVNDADYFLLVQSGSSKKVPYSVFKNDASDVGDQIHDTAQVLRNNVIWGIDAFATGTSGTALGYRAGYETSGNNSTYIGGNAGYTNNGNFSTFIGSTSGSASSSSVGYNAIIGYESFYEATGNYISSLGASSLQDYIGDYITGIGYLAGGNIGTYSNGNYNSYFGYNSKSGAANLVNSSAIGANATVLTDSTIVLGDSTDTKVTRDLYIAGDISSSYLTTNFASLSALSDTASAIRGDIPNVTFGTIGQIPYSNSGGDGWNYSSNFAFNGNALELESDSGFNNVFIGETSGNSILTGDNNVFLGSGSGYSTTIGTDNIFVGLDAGYLNQTGNSNIFIGSNSGISAINAVANIFLGQGAGFNHESGQDNTFLGYNSGHENVSGSGNVFLGYTSGYNETGSNKLYIENSNSSSPLIYGEFDNDKLRFNADTSTFVGHEKVDSNLYVQGSIISLSKIYASAQLPTDSATITTATLASTYYFVKGNFINCIGRGVDFIGDTLYVNRTGIDSVFIEYKHTARITSSKSATIRVGFSDNGAAISGTTKSSTFGAGSSQSITHFGTLWVKNNDAIKYVVESSAAANDVTFQEVSLIIEEKYTSENYNK